MISAGERPRSSCDLVVVGLGIHGALATLLAARRGLSVLAVERDDFGGATSWNSLRVLHGGLRYLQTGDLKRYRESVRSRSWFVREFPELVEPLACLMPLYGEGVRRAAFLGPAIRVDHFLRRLWSSEEDRRLIPPGGLVPVRTVLERFPAARREGLRGGAEWYDGWMPRPQRIVMECLRRAAAAGADARNYVEALGLLTGPDGRVEGVRLRDVRSGDGFEVRAPRVINCAGPWAADWLQGADVRLAGTLHDSTAFNLVLGRRLESLRSVAITPPGGGRTYFLHPRGDLTLAGTYHTPGTAASGAREADVDSFLRDIRRAVPSFELARSDVLRVMVGTLPAQRSGTADLLRRDIITRAEESDGPLGLVSLVGSKYTTAPESAARAVDLAFGTRKPARSGSPAPLGPSIRDIPDVGGLLELAAGAPDQARALVEALVEEEGVRTYDDLLLRRTDWGLVPDDAEAAEETVRKLGLELDS